MKSLTSYLFVLLSFVSSSLLMSYTMESNSIQAVILAAGSSSRFKTGTSKLLVPICGQAMILYPITLLETLNIPTTVVVGFQRDLVMQTINKTTKKPYFVVQEQQLGTGHALLCTQHLWNADNILVLNGDMPLISEDIITNLLKQHIDACAKISLVVSHNTDASIGYGRLVTKDGITRIVEAKHFTDTPEAFPLVNAGIFVINRAFLQEYLNKIPQNELTNEFYITDLIELASRNNEPFVPIEVPFDALHGVNTFKQLEKAERVKKRQLTDYWMAHGVRFENPKTVHLDLGVTIGARTIIGAGVELRGNTHIGQDCHIKSYSILENAHINDNSTIESHSTVRD